MQSYLRIPFLIVSGFFLALVSASGAEAQCGVNTIGFGNTGLVTGNPFHAEMVVTRSGEALVPSALAQRPRSVARDSQGRVRTERITEMMFKHDTGAEAGSEAEDHMIMICDPVAQTLTRIDTLNATAQIIHSRPSSPSSPGRSPGLPQRTFCSSRLLLPRAGGAATQDLGDQTIEGVQAHGVRTPMPMLSATVGGESSPAENFTECWCSDELSAVVLIVNENTKSGTKTTEAMQHIERNEPDAALFQIPAGYAVTESVAPPFGNQNPHVFTGTQR
jgi:hypothetical protein